VTAKREKGREENDDKWVPFIGVRRKGERLSVETRTTSGLLARLSRCRWAASASRAWLRWKQAGSAGLA
jgi:hypothetical protein